MNSNFKTKKDNFVNCTKKSIESLYLKFYPNKSDNTNKINPERTKTIDAIQNIKRLNVSGDIKNELQSMLYNDLEEREKYKFFSN